MSGTFVWCHRQCSRNCQRTTQHKELFNWVTLIKSIQESQGSEKKLPFGCHKTHSLFFFPTHRNAVRLPLSLPIERLQRHCFHITQTHLPDLSITRELFESHPQCNELLKVRFIPLVLGFGRLCDCQGVQSGFRHRKLQAVDVVAA